MVIIYLKHNVNYLAMYSINYIIYYYVIDWYEIYCYIVNFYLIYYCDNLTKASYSSSGHRDRKINN